MPELPEVEIARRTLVKWFDGHTLVRAEADPAARTFRGGKPEEFQKLEGRLEAADRKGKYLMLSFEHGRGLLGHLGMTGKFVKRDPKVVEPWSRARFHLDSGEVIHFKDPRLFGQLIALPADSVAQHKAVENLGLDPLLQPLTAQSLKSALGATTVDLKVALMDQSKVAGLGNIHAAEALFRAKLHPGRKVSSLTDADFERLATSITEGIEFALTAQAGDEIEYIEEGGANPFFVYGRAGEPCRVCQTPVAESTQQGRTTFHCPGCQSAPTKPKGTRKSTTPKKTTKPKRAVRKAARR